MHAELLKLSTTRAFAALAGTAVAISLLITILVALLTEPTEKSVLSDVFTNDVSGVFILVLAVVGITGEWRHRTITSSLLAAPDRLRFLAAKTIAFAAAGLALSLLVSLAIAVVGFVILSARDLRPRRSGRSPVRSRASPSSRRFWVGSGWPWGHWCETRWWPSLGCCCSRSSSSPR